MHLIGVRRTLAENHPWLPAAVLKAFEQAKALAFDKLADTSASKVMLPFVDHVLQEAQDLMGRDFWPAHNSSCLEYFLRQHHRQGLSDRLVATSELFHPTTFEASRI
jgi:4,5-dihydroxyphthalate decarboxylase